MYPKIKVSMLNRFKENQQKLIFAPFSKLKPQQWDLKFKKNINHS